MSDVGAICDVIRDVLCTLLEDDELVDYHRTIGKHRDAHGSISRDPTRPVQINSITMTSKVEVSK